MSNPTRTIHVLMYGIHKVRYRRYREYFLPRLKGEDSSWDITTAYANTVNNAIAYVEHHDDLDLVYFPVDVANYQSNFDMFFYDLMEIGGKLAVHPNRPWAVCHPGVNSLVQLFKELVHIKAVDLPLVVAAKNRWQSRLEKLPAPRR